MTRSAKMDTSIGWRSRLGSALTYGFSAAIITLMLALGLSAAIGRDLEEQTADDVAGLVREAELNREVLCLAVVRPSLKEELPPGAYARILELCGTVTGPNSNGHGS